MSLFGKKYVHLLLLGVVAASANVFAVISGKDTPTANSVAAEQKATSLLDRSVSKPILKANSCGEPIYPALSKRNNEEGRVGVQLWINESGNVVTAKVAVSSGFPSLDEGAIAFLSRCKFEPAMKDGVPVAVWLPLYHRWALADSPDEKPVQPGDYNFEDKTQSPSFMSYLKESCSSYVSSFNNNETEDYEKMGVKKISEADVCACAEARIKTDKYLKPFAAEKEPDIESTMNVDIFRAYSVRRTTAILLECTAKTIDASISKLDPRKVKQ